MFVHRNIANVVADGDTNCLAVLQYAVDVLRVENVIVVGHYGCGGVKAALDGNVDGPVAEWIAPIGALADAHASELTPLAPDDQHRRLCELNAVAQAANVAATPIVRDAWARGQDLAVRAWIYDVATGLLRDLGPTLTRPA
jgi:carbonic anhydrase